jgi:hypothetical protein
MSLALRESRVFASTAGDPVFGSSYLVTAYGKGGQVASASTGVTVTVRSGHGFSAGQKFIVNTDVTKYRTVDSLVGNVLTVNSAVTVAAGDFLINLGADTGTTTPSYNGSTLNIYEDEDSVTALTNETVTAGATGTYRYYWNGAPSWELIRTAAGTPIAFNLDVQSTGAVIGPDSSIDNAIVRYDGTTGRLVQGYSSALIAPTISDLAAMLIPVSLKIGAGFTSSFDTTVYIAPDAKSAPSIQTQAMYIQHRVSGLSNFVHDAGASELRLNAFTSNQGQNALEASIVLSSGAISVTTTIAALRGNLSVVAGVTGSVTNAAMLIGQTVDALPVGFTIPGVLASVWAQAQTVGAENYNVYGPGGNSLFGGALIDGAAGTVRDLILRTAGIARWIIRANGTAESGSQAGSDLDIIARDDAGGNSGSAFFINRATKKVGINATDPATALDVNGALRTRKTSVDVTGNDAIVTAARSFISLTNVSGTNTITLSAPSSIDGAILYLKCAAITAGSLTLADSGNVDLNTAAGSWVPTAGDTLTLIADGVVWSELSRSTN